MWFDKKDPEERYLPKDEYQRKYRQAFEGIVDKYLIYHCEDEDAKNVKEEQDNIDSNAPTSQVQSDDNGAEYTDSQGRKHKGILKIDATCADAEVRFPVDVDIIHDGCKVVDRYLASLCNALAISLLERVEDTRVHCQND